ALASPETELTKNLFRVSRLSGWLRQARLKF
ncbi:MAG: hypothetical protein ACI9Y8_001789, partial [Candidatus Omnitrophota bacterium]